MYRAWQERWRIFNEWERRQPPEESTPAERVHMGGELFEFYLKFGWPMTDPERDEETIRHARRMRELLSRLPG